MSCFCDKCEKTFTSKDTLRKHYSLKHDLNGKKIECGFCMKTFTKNSSLKRHVQSVHEKTRFKCDTCEKQFSCHDHVQRHKQSAHDGQKFKCEKCKKEFVEKNYFEQHIKALHEGIKLQCDKCEKYFDHKYSWRIHLEWHDLKENGLIMICRQCGEKFSKRNLFLRHVRIIHKGLEIEPEIVFEDERDNKHQDFLKSIENKVTVKPKVISSKPRKGRWIVKLERLTKK